MNVQSKYAFETKTMEYSTADEDSILAMDFGWIWERMNTLFMGFFAFKKHKERKDAWDKKMRLICGELIGRRQI